MEIKSHLHVKMIFYWRWIYSSTISFKFSSLILRYDSYGWLFNSLPKLFTNKKHSYWCWMTSICVTDTVIMLPTCSQSSSICHIIPIWTVKIHVAATSIHINDTSMSTYEHNMVGLLIIHPLILMKIGQPRLRISEASVNTTETCNFGEPNERKIHGKLSWASGYYIKL